MTTYKMLGFILLLCTPFSGIAQKCFDVAARKGDLAFKNGKYAEAIKLWEAALKCTEVPAKNDLDIRINQAKLALKAPQKQPEQQRPQPQKTQNTNRPQKPNKTESPSQQRQAETTNYDADAWAVAKKAQTIDGYKAYLSKYPRGQFATEAQSAMEVLIYTPSMVKIEEGSFEMGSNDPNYYADERPAHTVLLRGYAIGKYEITQGQWKAVMGNFPDGFTYDNCDDCPMNFVSWNDIQAFLTKLNQKTGKKYRLPTEAEWEYAAKGGKVKSSYLYSGGNAIDKIAWYADNSTGKIKSVGKKSPNELGLFDLTGNVQEWCEDFYSETYYKSSPSKNPVNTKASDTHVVRGSSAQDSAEDSRLTFRISENASAKSEKIGFRVAID